MANHAFLISLLFLQLLLLCFEAESEDNKVVKISRDLFIWKDAEEGTRCSRVAHSEEGSVFSLLHKKSRCSPFHPSDSTWSHSIFDSIERDNHRYNQIVDGRVSFSASRMSTQEDTDQPLASAPSGNYIVKLGFGTPAQSFYTVVDTGSDITWIPSTSCSSCNKENSQPFDPSKSSTYKFLTCSSMECQAIINTPNCGNYNCSITETYGDGSQLGELLSKDTLTVGAQTVPSFTFGSATDARGLIQSAPGLVGFGRGSLSFVSQTNNLYGATFSYCLPSLGSSDFPGSLRLGKTALSLQGLQFTPLLKNAKKPSFYYVGLNGFSVGNERVSVPPGTLDIDQSTGRGTIIDSGTVITRLAKAAYNPMRDSFRRQVSNLTMAAPVSIFDTCYNVPASGVIEVPQITLNFDGGLEWALPRENFLYPADDKASVVCLAFALPPGDSASTSVISVIGNYQQQNFRVVHDVPGSRLGIAEENCSG